MVTQSYFHNFQNELLRGSDINFESDTFKVALMTSSYTPSLDTHVYFEDVIDDEVVATNYISQGLELQGQSVTRSTSANNVVTFDANDVTWENVNLSTLYYIIYKDTGDISTSPLVILGEFDTIQSPVSTFTIQWSTSGIFSVIYG